jgi:hypothetical protein
VDLQAHLQFADPIIHFGDFNLHQHDKEHAEAEKCSDSTGIGSEQHLQSSAMEGLCGPFKRDADAVLSPARLSGPSICQAGIAVLATSVPSTHMQATLILEHFAHLPPAAREHFLLW